ncbi:hypothetical protein F2Q69_00024688 [Brassica cretica]|uniref:DUF223 domain-containing protein n=1 Tax=Brassica cretica TaxID=69181 RepID=A0A8S9Q9T5_BRACR|nr:hypothetical protein F2Q69_00024688 [Brassica cretica]
MSLSSFLHCLKQSEHSLWLPRFWDSLNFKKDREFVGITVLFLDENVNPVIHGFTPVGRANHYMPSLKAGSIVKVDRFEMWLGKSVLSRALASPKKQLESLSVFSLIHSVIHGFTPVGRANHYMPSLKAGSIVKVDRFEVSRCSSMYKITNHPFLIRFISLTIIDEVITGAPEINLQSRLDYSTISK